MTEEKKSGGFLRALKRMVSSTAELESEDLRREAEREGARQVVSCADREKVVLRGTIRAVTHPPLDEAPRLEAEFDDGSGVVTLIWMGRREISGVQAGSILKIEGRISCHKDRRTMYNPRYELTHVPGVA